MAEFKKGDVLFIKGKVSGCPFVLEILEPDSDRTLIKILCTSISNYEVGEIQKTETDFLKTGSKITKKELKTYKLLYFS